MSPRHRVAVVTGGAGGIGASIAEALGRDGWYVVTLDPLVTLDGTEQLPQPEDSTAARIVAAGGSARASSASVTDAKAVTALFEELVDEHGGLHAVVNVAGITRQSYFARGTEEDWVSLLDVHLSGYLNVLEAALPLMAEAGHGRILGVTSGSGWRAADAGGYSAAKRVVAALTWQLGRVAPPGVTVNALSPIANTRMVAAALERARAEGRAGGGGGLSLDAIPGPENLGPLAAYLVSDEAAWCSGQVFFAGGSEVAVVDRPRLVEVVRTEGVASLAGVLDAALPRAFVTAETNQATDGGANPRFGSIFDAPAPAEPAEGDVQSCAIVSERADLTAALTAALEARSIACHTVSPARDFSARPPRCGPPPPWTGPGRSTPSWSLWPGTPPAPPLRRPRRSGRPSWPTTTGSSRTSRPTPPGPEPPRTLRRSRNVRYGSSPSPMPRRPVAEAARRPRRRSHVRPPAGRAGGSPRWRRASNRPRRTRPHNRANWW